MASGHNISIIKKFAEARKGHVCDDTIATQWAILRRIASRIAMTLESATAEEIKDAINELASECGSS